MLCWITLLGIKSNCVVKVCQHFQLFFVPHEAPEIFYTYRAHQTATEFLQYMYYLTFCLVISKNNFESVKLVPKMHS